MFSNKKKDLLELMNVSSNSEAYQAYQEVRLQRDNQVQIACGMIDNNIKRAITNNKLKTNITIECHCYHDNAFTLRKKIKNYLKSKGYKVNIFIGYSYGLVLCVFVSWKFKLKEKDE